MKNSSITGVMVATEAAPEWLAPTLAQPEPVPALAVQPPGPAPVEATQALGGRRKAALWLAGGGAALVGGGAVFGLLARGSRDDVARLQADGGPVRLENAAEGVAGGAAIVAGAVMGTFGGGEAGTTVLPAAGGVAVAGSFWRGRRGLRRAGL